jgi:hypothetical protein
MTDKPTYFLIPAVATYEMRTAMRNQPTFQAEYGAALAARPASYIALEAAWEELRDAMEDMAEMGIHTRGCSCELCRGRKALTALSEAEAAAKKEVGA